MANETTITVIGRLTEDPTLRFTQSGTAVANVTVASNARTFNKQTNEWEDQPATFWPGSVWRDQAEHVANALRKGVEVIVVGNVVTESWTSKEGDKRSRLALDIQNIGPALRYQEADVRKAQRNQGGTGGGFGGASTPVESSSSNPASSVGWGNPAGDAWGNQAGGGWGGNPTGEVPF